MNGATEAPGAVSEPSASSSVIKSKTKPALVVGILVAAMGLASGAAAQMMMLPGQFDVSPTGAALYSVPIEVPPGTGGMTPALTLDYDSDGGNGLLGVGWNLGGLPSIGRCPKTVATDGVKGRVDFTLNDRFCMDGQRLVLVAGTYGGAGSEYRTEIEGFTKIIANGTAGNGPQSFTAWTKSGQTIWFGCSVSSRMLATGTSTVRSWAVCKIADTKDNWLWVAYSNNATTGEAYPTAITYGAAGTTAYDTVEFAYEGRPDVVPLYIAGSTVKLTQRLKKVNAYAGTTADPKASLVRSYELTYATSSSTQRSKVTSIKLCDGSATPSCLPATSFSMTTASLTFPTLSTNPIATTEMGSSVALYVGDWNGDGIADAMTWNPSTGANKWFVNNGSLGFTITTNAIPTAQITGSSTELYLGDWDGDAITDVLWFKSSTGDNRWFVNSSTGGAPAFVQTTNPIAIAQLSGGTVNFGDWNGDAKTDLMWFNSQSGSNRWFTNTYSTALTFSQANDRIAPSDFTPVQNFQGTWVYWNLNFADWNGDGLTELMAYLPVFAQTMKWYLNDGALNFTTAGSFGNTLVGSINIGDWNGDGIADLLLYKASTGANQWYLNNGAAAFSLAATDPIAPATITNQDYILNIGDWNSDGLSDVMFHLPSSGSNRWFTTSWSSSGTIQFAYSADPIAVANLSGTGGAVAFGDWNGRGFEMPMFRLPSNGTNRWWRNDAAIPPERLASATTGLGSTTDFTYQPLTASGVYTKYANATYPVIDIEAPFYVVTRVDADNGVGGDYSSTYSYKGAKIDVSGRGFLGFSQQISTDLQTGIVQTLTFFQSFPYIGFVAEDKKTLGAVVLNERDNDYSATTTGVSPNIRKWPYLQSVTEASKDLNGTAFPTVTTDYTYDAWGNPLTIAVSTPDLAVRTTTNTYSNNATTWILGRLLSSTVVSTTPDTPPAPTGCQTNCSSPPP